jgi:hypothetical protein
LAHPRDIPISEAIWRYGLPQLHRVHWSRTRKERVVCAMRERAISFPEAHQRYLLSHSEFSQWESDFVADSRHIEKAEHV